MCVYISFLAQRVKASACNEGGVGSIPGLGRSPGEGNGSPLQYSCLENSMDGEAWWATVHGVTKSRTGLSDFTSLHFTFIGTRMVGKIEMLVRGYIFEVMWVWISLEIQGTGMMTILNTVLNSGNMLSVNFRCTCHTQNTVTMIWILAWL